MSRAFSWVIVEMILKMPKPATNRMAATTVYMMTLRMTITDISASFASCHDAAL